MTKTCAPCTERKITLERVSVSPFLEKPTVFYQPFPFYGKILNPPFGNFVKGGGSNYGVEILTWLTGKSSEVNLFPILIYPVTSIVDLMRLHNMYLFDISFLKKMEFARFKTE